MALADTRGPVDLVGGAGWVHSVPAANIRSNGEYGHGTRVIVVPKA